MGIYISTTAKPDEDKFAKNIEGSLKYRIKIFSIIKFTKMSWFEKLPQ